MDTLSVIEAIWNLPGSWLDYNLMTLSSQTCPPLEIVVVNASPDPGFFKQTEDVCAKYPLVKMVPAVHPKFNLAYSYNVAIQASQGTYVMATCIDKLFSHRFIEEVYSLMAPRCMVTSNSFHLPIGFDIGDVNTLMDRWQEVYSHRIIQSLFAVGTIMAVEREWLFKVRGFDEINHPFNYNDSDLMLRGTQDGFGPYPIVHEEIAQCLHIGHPSTLYSGFGGHYPDATRPTVRNPEHWGNM
jgi:hypothetical protein